MPGSRGGRSGRPRAQGTMHLNMNSGLFYIKASPKTVAFMDRIAARLSREKAWDQVPACLHFISI